MDVIKYTTNTFLQTNLNRSRLQQRIAVLNSTPKQSANIEETVKHFQMVIEAALLKAEFGIEGLEKLLKVHQTPAQRNCIELFTRLPPKGSINASKSTYIKPPSNQNYLRNSTSRNDIHDALSWNSQSTLKEPFQPRPIKGIIKEDRSTETSTNPDSTLLFKIPSATASQITVKVGKCVAFSAERLRSTKSYPADKDLQKHFDRFGFVEEVYRSRRPSNGFIVFESSDAAKAALSELNHEASGCRLTLKQTKPEFKLPKKKAQPSIQFEDYPVNLVAVCSCIRFQTLVRQSKCAQPTNSAIKKHFRKIGKLVAFYKEEDDPNGFVVFTNVATAQKALSKKNHVVEGCELKLIPSSRDLSKDERYIDFLESDVVRCKRLVFQALTAQCNVPCPSEEALRSYFATFGKIVDFYKHPIHPNGDMVFKKLSDATSAFFTPNHVVQGCTIKLVATSHYV